MATYDHFRFIDQLADSILVDETPTSRKALTALKEALNTFKLEKGLPPSILYDESIPYDRPKYRAELEKAEPWQCFKGVRLNIELAHLLVSTQEALGGLSRDNLWALARLLRETKRTPANRDNLLCWAHRIAFTLISSIAPNRHERAARKRAKQSVAAHETAQKKRAKTTQVHERRIQWAQGYILKQGPRNLRKALETQFKISRSSAQKIVNEAKKVF